MKDASEIYSNYDKSEKGKARKSRYKQSEKGKETRKEYEKTEKRKAYRKKWLEEKLKDPEYVAKRKEWQRKADSNRCKNKVKARKMARRLEKKPCEKCGEIKAEAHHEDYDKPLDVVWLCHKHHREIHNDR